MYRVEFVSRIIEEVQTAITSVKELNLTNASVFPVLLWTEGNLTAITADLITFEKRTRTWPQKTIARLTQKIGQAIVSSLERFELAVTSITTTHSPRRKETADESGSH